MAWVPSVSRTSLNAQNTAESTSCALSTKIKPDSRGLVPGIHDSCFDLKTWMAGTSPAKTQPGGLFLQKTGEFLLKARQPAATIDQMLLAAGPGRMRFRIDVEPHGVPGLPPCAAGLEFAAVGHHHLDGVIVRMDVALHGSSGFSAAPAGARRLRWRGKFAGSIAQPK